MKRFTPSSQDDTISSVITQIVSQFGPSQIEQEEGWDALKGYDVEEFLADAKTLFEKHNQLTKEFEGLTFLPENTYQDIEETEACQIRFQLQKRTFGIFNQQSKPHDGVRAVKPILIDILEDIDHPGYKVLAYAQFFDNSIEFTSWSKNYRDANRGAIMIERFFQFYEPIFKMKGLQLIRYNERGTDQLRESGTYALHGAPVRYYIRTFQLQLVYEKTLESIVIETLLTK